MGAKRKRKKKHYRTVFPPKGHKIKKVQVHRNKRSVTIESVKT